VSTAFDQERLTATFAALASTTRRTILARLAEGEATVNELAEPFEMTLPAISKHIKVLERAGLVTRGRRAQYRPCVLEGARLAEVSSWAEQYRPLWEDRFDQLDGYLAHLVATAREEKAMTDTDGLTDSVVIERSFDAPVELIWQMWTDPKHFMAWYGPAGASIPVANMDVRVGGARQVCMEVRTPNGPMRMWFVGEFREVIANQRLVYTESMSDGAGNVLSPSDLGMPEGHPVTTEVSVELTDVGGRTKMVMTHAGIPADSPGAAGWSMAFDKLDDYVVEESRR
jgi:uncharacterized protein YndB with AHSA1/START domain/DNA-binding transcriptional ArsR family regulator